MHVCCRSLLLSGKIFQPCKYSTLFFTDFVHWFQTRILNFCYYMITAKTLTVCDTQGYGFSYFQAQDDVKNSDWLINIHLHITVRFSFIHITKTWDVMKTNILISNPFKQWSLIWMFIAGRQTNIVLILGLGWVRLG